MAYFGNIGENIIENINSKMRKKSRSYSYFHFLLNKNLKKHLDYWNEGSKLCTKLII